MSRIALFRAEDTVRYIWKGLGLPAAALDSLQLLGSGRGLPSSFKVGHLAQASISLSALSAALVYAHGYQVDVPRVTVDLPDAVSEFKSERLLSIDGKRPSADYEPLGGLHKAADGYIRVHDGFPNHRHGTKKLLKCEDDADRAAVAVKIADLTAIGLETAAAENGLAMAALRSLSSWDATPQAKATMNFPISIRKLSDGPAGLCKGKGWTGAQPKCLSGLHVVEMTRVIAAPVAGRTLAAHGADVIWITSPTLPDQPDIDRDMARGKRTARLDIDNEDNKQSLYRLLEDADVFLQSYRPGSLAQEGFGPEEIARRSKKGIICANLSAYGPAGPWRFRRGFDSLVQTCSGLNVSEAEHFGAGEVARPLPCQALDHASGYFLATGVNAALYRQATEGGSYEVNVSLAGTVSYLRSLGQFEGNTGFDCDDFNSPEEVPARMFEERDSGFGKITAVKHSAHIEGIDVGYSIMPKPLGSDRPEWLE